MNSPDPRKVPVGSAGVRRGLAPLSTRNGLRVTMAAMMSSASAHRVLRAAVSARSHRSRRRAPSRTRPIPKTLTAADRSRRYRRRGRASRPPRGRRRGRASTPNATARSHTAVVDERNRPRSRRAPGSSRRRTQARPGRYRLRHRPRVAPAALGAKMSSKLNGASRDDPHSRAPTFVDTPGTIRARPARPAPPRASEDPAPASS